MALNIPNLTIQQLEYLVAVDEHNTWGEAAHALGVSASALSQGMSELQKRIGVQLFRREGRGMEARPSASVVVDYARRVLTETRDLARWAEQSRSGQTGRVSVGMIDTAAIHYFSDELAAYREEHRAVELHLRVKSSSALLKDLRSGLLDLIVGVASEDMDRADLDVTELVAEALYVYAPAGQEKKPPREWGPWVSFPADSHSRRLIARGVRDLGAPFNVTAESSQPDVLREMVHLGVGWTVLPQLEAEREPHPLTPARRNPVAHRQLILVQRAGRPREEAVAQLAHAITQAASGRRG